MASTKDAVAPGEESEYEQWENTTAANYCLRFYNQQGILTDKIINGRRKFQITPKERKLNQEMAADESYDAFSNGVFAPVRLIEGTADAAKIRSNPNLVSESEMKTLLAKTRTAKAFQERIDTISNPHALTRMLEIASADDTATAKQVLILQERLRAVAPSIYNEVATVGGPTTPSGPVAVTTRDLGTR